MTDRLAAHEARLGYDRRIVSEAVTATVPEDSFTVIIGPNGCGKSTLLRGFARLLQPTAGRIVLDGDDIRALRTREVARRLALLPQSSTAPEAITVRELVARGRFPHQGMFASWSSEDERATVDAIAQADLAELADRAVDELSGGQRQRAWVAMALAQSTPALLLDEPTTYLDLAHQYELLELFSRLHHEGRTIVAVLHDLTQAARFATHLIVMSDGAVVASGAPADVLSEELVERVFGLPVLVMPDPVTGTPLVLPRRPPRGTAAQ